MPLKEIVKRFFLSMLAGLLLGWGLSETSYYFLKTGETRPPQTIELDIPAGTAERVAQGQADPSLPSSMVFVVGDTLLVKNQDSVPHQLGPLFIPAGSSASMLLNVAQDYAYSCSFQPSKYIGLSVQSPLDLSTRLTGVLEAGVPMGFLIALYSIILTSPPKRKAMA
jgi:hypothetical protein